MSRHALFCVNVVIEYFSAVVAFLRVARMVPDIVNRRCAAAWVRGCCFDNGDVRVYREGDAESLKGSESGCV